MAAEVAEQQTQDEPPDFPDVQIKRRFLIKREGKDFITYPGLVDALHALSEGYFELSTAIAQLPSAENGQTAVVTARVAIFDNQNRDTSLREATGIGDANPGNVNRGMAGHLIRLAETRAKARALRDLLNVGTASIEELGPPEDEVPARTPASERPAQRQAEAPGGWSLASGQMAVYTAPQEDHIMVDGRSYGRSAVWEWYQRRVAAAREKGVKLSPEEAGRKRDDPLGVLVGISQEIKRRMEADAKR